jgi:hypothetical protein
MKSVWLDPGPAAVAVPEPRPSAGKPSSLMSSRRTTGPSTSTRRHGLRKLPRAGKCSRCCRDRGGHDDGGLRHAGGGAPLAIAKVSILLATDSSLALMQRRARAIAACGVAHPSSCHSGSGAFALSNLLGARTISLLNVSRSRPTIIPRFATAVPVPC